MTESIQKDTQSTSLADGWMTVTLDEVAEIITGNTPPKKDHSNYGQYLPLVKPGELLDAPVAKAEDNLSEKGARLARVLPPDSVLVSCIGNLGKTAISQVPVAFNQQINAAVFSGSVIPKFGFYYFQTSDVKDWMHKRASATTVTILNKGKFSELPFPVAPFNEQRRIVEKIEELFTKLDAGVRFLEQVREQLKSYRRSVLKAAVEGELSREWRGAHRDEIEPASELLKRILQERREKFAAKKYKEPVSPDTLALPTLPDGWVWTTVSQLSTKVTDGVHRTPTYVDDGVPFLSVNNMSEKGTLSFSPCKYITRAEHQELYQRCNPDRDDVLLSKVGTVGLTAVVTTDVEFSLFVNTALIKPIYRHVSSRFLASSIRHGFAAGLYSRHVGGSNQKFIGTTKIGSLPTPLPPLAEQQVIVDELERRLSVVDKLEATVEVNLKQATGLRQSILKQAFSGELVSQDPNDEPAGVLLERIRKERDAGKQKSGKGRKRNTAPAKSNHAEQGG